MADTTVEYLGLALRNPIVVSSSSLANTVEKVEKADQAGAGAVVLKSLFEEEIQAEIDADAEHSIEHTEALDYIRATQTGAGLKRYTDLIRGSKQKVQIPVIASVNAVSSDWWIEHVPSLESAGADAIELNISLMPYDYHDNDERIITFYEDTVKAVRKVVNVPLAVKIGYHFSSIPAVIDRLRWAGASSVVLFNRFYQLDIDIEQETLKSASPFSTPDEISLPLRWLTWMYGKTDVQLAASSGIHDGEGAIKALLAGAQVVQVCSALYKRGYEHIGEIVVELEKWMDAHRYNRIADFRGKLSQKLSDKPETFERLQYIRALVGRE